MSNKTKVLIAEHNAKVDQLRDSIKVDYEVVKLLELNLRDRAKVLINKHGNK